MVVNHLEGKEEETWVVVGELATKTVSRASL